MQGKNLTVAMLSMFLSIPVFASQEEAVTRAAGAYMHATHVLQSLKQTSCGYALLMDVDELSRKAEQDILNTIQSKYQKDLSSNIKQSKQNSTNLVTKDIEELENKSTGKLDGKTTCGLMVGGSIAIYNQYFALWENAKKNP